MQKSYIITILKKSSRQKRNLGKPSSIENQRIVLRNIWEKEIEKHKNNAVWVGNLMCDSFYCHNWETGEDVFYRIEEYMDRLMSN
jgi:hypothetical protein